MTHSPVFYVLVETINSDPAWTGAVLVKIIMFAIAIQPIGEFCSELR
jgi:hypothetical protein